MSQSHSHFEIIEAEPPQTKRKPKHRRYPLFGHMPWHQLSLTALTGITIGLALALMFTRSFSRLVPVPPVPTLPRPPTIHRASPALSLGGPVTSISYSSDKAFVLGRPSGVSLYTFNEPTLSMPVDTQQVDYDGYRVILLRTSHAGGKTFTNLQAWDPRFQMVMSEAQIYTGSTPDHPVETAFAVRSSYGTVAFGGAGWITLRHENVPSSVLSTIPTHAQGTTKLSFMDNHNYLSAVLQYDTPSAMPGWETLLQVWDVHGQDWSGFSAPTLLMSMPIFRKYSDRAVFSDNGRFFAYVAPNANDPSSDTVHVVDVSHLTEIGTVTFPPTTRISALAIDQYSLIVIQPSGDQYTLQAFHWRRNSAGFQYISMGQSPAIAGSGANYLHLWPDSRGLDYVDLDSNSLRNWIFD